MLDEERVLVLQVSEKALKLIEYILIKFHKRGMNEVHFTVTGTSEIEEGEIESG